MDNIGVALAISAFGAYLFVELDSRIGLPKWLRGLGYCFLLADVAALFVVSILVMATP